MARKLFQRIMPHPDRVRSHRWLRGLGHVLHQPSLWHLNRHSAARAMGVGVFWSFIPLPGQTVFSVLTAIKLRGNVALAVAVPWIAPFVLFPAYYLSYRVGLLLLWQEPMDDFFDGFRRVSLAWFREHARAILPFLVGSIPVSLALGAAAYFGTHWLWRTVLLRRMRRRAERLKREARACQPVEA